MERLARRFQALFQLLRRLAWPPEVIVDNFAEARQRDVLNLAEEMEDSLDKDAKFLEVP